MLRSIGRKCYDKKRVTNSPLAEIQLGGNADESLCAAQRSAKRPDPPNS